MFTPTLRCECAQPGLIDTIWEWSICWNPCVLGPTWLYTGSYRVNSKWIWWATIGFSSINLQKLFSIQKFQPCWIWWKFSVVTESNTIDLHIDWFLTSCHFSYANSGSVLWFLMEHWSTTFYKFNFLKKFFPKTSTHIYRQSLVFLQCITSIELYELLITCVIARSNPRRFFSFYPSTNGSHYHVTMTPHNDLRTRCHEHKVRFLLKRQTSVCTTPPTHHAFITLHNDRHVWSDRNSLT